MSPPTKPTAPRRRRYRHHLGQPAKAAAPGTKLAAAPVPAQRPLTPAQGAAQAEAGPSQVMDLTAHAPATRQGGGSGETTRRRGARRSTSYGTTEQAATKSDSSAAMDQAGPSRRRRGPNTGQRPTKRRRNSSESPTQRTGVKAAAVAEAGPSTRLMDEPGAGSVQARRGNSLVAALQPWHPGAAVPEQQASLLGRAGQLVRGFLQRFGA